MPRALSGPAPTGSAPLPLLRLPALPADAPWRRHDLVWLRRDLPADAPGWHAAPADHALAAAWIDAGRPLVVSRQMPDADPAQGIAAGVTLPGIGPRRRVALALLPTAVERRRGPLTLDEVLPAAPPAWQPALARLAADARRLGLSVGVYGSLVTQAVSGERCLRPASDLDLIVDCADADELRRALAWLAAADAGMASPRLDGELRLGGWAVAWRELAALLAVAPATAARRCLAKSDHAVALLALDDWLACRGEAHDADRRAA